MRALGQRRFKSEAQDFLLCFWYSQVLRENLNYITGMLLSSLNLSVTLVVLFEAYSTTGHFALDQAVN
jgi:hypothetical protein